MNLIKWIVLLLSDKPNIHVAEVPHNCVSNAAYMHLEYENGFMLIESEGINLQVGEKNSVA